MGSPPVPTITTTTQFQRPDKLRSETNMVGAPFAAKPTIAVRDGDRKWVYMGMLNQYIEKTGAEAGDPSLFAAGPFGADPSSLFTQQLTTGKGFGEMLKHAVILPRKEMVGEHSSRVVETRFAMPAAMLKEMKVPPGADEMFKRPIRATFFIDDESVIRKVALDLTDNFNSMMKSMGPAAGGGPDIESMVINLTFTQFEPNVTFPEGTFTFTPPEGATLVKDFDFGKMAGVAAAGGDASLEGKPAPSFALKTSEGKLIDLKELRGKPVLINFYGEF